MNYLLKSIFFFAFIIVSLQSNAQPGGAIWIGSKPLKI